LKKILVGLLAAIKFERTKLQPFFKNLARAAVAETHAHTADVDPMRAHGQKRNQRAAMKKRRIDHDII